MIAHIRKETGERQSVEKHLLGTAEIAKDLGRELGIEALAELTALVHDLGKMRKRFEEYLIASVTESRKTRRGEVNHSSAGAIFLEENYNNGEDFAKLTAQLMVVAVFSHHGLNDCIDPVGKNCYQKRVEHQKDLDYEEVIENFKGSVFNFVSLTLYLIPEVGCGQSPQILMNTEYLSIFPFKE